MIIDNLVFYFGTMDGFLQIMALLNKLLQVFVFGITIYFFIISIFGWIKRREFPLSDFEPIKKFALVVAAHNEEAVIGAIIRNLKNINYPAHLYDIFVIADNCTDKTAKIATLEGANVLERFDLINRGKGFALEYMFESIFKMNKKYDAVCVFDADNLVSKNFLLEMNKQFCRGYEAVQGYLDSKNPVDSYIACSYSLSFWMSNRLLQLPRYYLGLSCYLGGTGFAISTDVLQKIKWSAFSLTEDLEYTLKLILEGKKVYWSHDAIIYDEKPLTFMQSWKQRKRWMQGTADCIFRYFIPSFKKAVKEMDFVALDCAIYLLYPLVILFSQVYLIVNTIDLADSFIASSSNFSDEGINIFSLILTIFVIYMNGIFVYLEGKLTKKTLWYFILYPLYSLSWIPIIIVGFIHKNKRDWVHTLHTRAIDITEIEEIEPKKVG